MFTYQIVILLYIPLFDYITRLKSLRSLCPYFQEILLLLPRNQMPLFYWLVSQSQTSWKDIFILSSSTSSSLDTLSLSDSKSESLASPCRIPQYSTIFGLRMLRPNALTMLARMDARMTRRRVKMLWYDVTWNWVVCMEIDDFSRYILTCNMHEDQDKPFRALQQLNYIESNRAARSKLDRTEQDL